MQKLIIEARVNEYTMRDPNPHVPWTADEIAHDAAECREAGAAILHFHARQADGSPDFSFEAFRDVLLAARERSDLLIHPTLGYGRLDANAEERMDNIVRLAADPRTLPDFAPMDMGSTNVDWYDPEGRRYLTKGMIYSNGTDTLEHFARTIRRHDIIPYLTSWNVGFTRQIGAFLDMGLLAAPAYICLSLTEGPMLAGHPGTAEGLDAAIAFLPRNHRVEWTVCVFGGDLLPLAATIIGKGGHISIGTGDYGYVEYGQPTNAELVRRIADLSRSLGREVATPEEAREILAPAPVGMHSLALP